MDLQAINSVETLKALAFDQIQAIEQSQNNLRLIQQRLAQVEQDSTNEATNG